ncbi:8-amino-7-oxononanoate synthase [Janthinobacterium sp. Marseille]|uniref:8-amino-7-oxononanoate synthase n=1 Tax=Janthinobacterium sp. (strain Marseille) TaxID=375286 RepID=BIOF_JANMA|nr:8-amino-7-oxononanoate synthase [Janthinobacterium sp. Marseille]A6SU64.1 RecName: Full=8-amino-7-oxononanoate synthase; Short=AONS; AltName: Full=7-keto-8-amino-pelargonic acid synthase; Short=7-KAP synthase; Short=KAPA synthase; AltName: Full=8-amino-7-ketopelargonate synthase [Janthinobacterium sp. Marseille]ABR88577.1 8-amino-7-oxononanoate synthase [Janthinobacterium sp. Marseille]
MNKLIAGLEQQLAQLDAQSLRRRRRTTESPCAPRVQVDGRAMLAFCSNDYLGLAAHPRIIDALQQGASLYGAGSGASHLISGHSRAHAELEERLAEFVAPQIADARALYFCTGYMANIAILSALSGSGADLFSESLNHASLIDGARLSRANVQVYPHGDLDKLAILLAASTADNKMVVTDSVFSMDGDLAALPQLLALCEQHGAWLVVDDAHGFGVLGEHGRGVLEHFALRSPNLVYMGTLGKAAGVAGAFVAAHKSVIEWMVQRARPYIYTTAAPPAVAHALLTSLEIIGGAEGAERRAHLQTLIAQWRSALQLQRWRALASDTAIQPVVIGANDVAMKIAAALYEQNIWVPAIRPPTVPAGTARLRVTLSAAHTAEQVTQLVGALQQLEQQD